MRALTRLFRTAAIEPEPTTDPAHTHAVTVLLTLARQLRQGAPYRELPLSPEGFGALIREALDDLATGHAREVTMLTATLGEVRDELDLRDAVGVLPSAPTPEQLWLHVRTSEQGKRARHFQRLYGQASQTIGRQRAELAQQKQLADYWRGQAEQLAAALPAPAEAAAVTAAADAAAVGDPDPTAAERHLPGCVASTSGWACTRTAGHRGQHVAGGGKVHHVWPNIGAEQSTADEVPW